MSNDARQIFAVIDTMDADAFVQHLTPDVHFVFGNNDPAEGRAAVKGAVTGFFSTIGGLTHHVREVWDVEDGTVSICHIDVEYRRRDGKTVTVPNIDILRWDGDQVADWKIVIDLAPVYA